MYGIHEVGPMAGPSSYHSSPTMGGELKEYEVKDLLVYVSKAANANRKVCPGSNYDAVLHSHRGQLQPPAVPRKRADKRESVRNMPSSSDLSQKKIKGAKARLRLPDGLPDRACREVELAEPVAWDKRRRSLAVRELQAARVRGGHHAARVPRRAFHASVPDGSFTLTRARQNTVLYASMYVHALKHTDIRVVHRSLFERKDVLGIYWGTYVPLPCASRLQLMKRTAAARYP